MVNDIEIINNFSILTDSKLFLWGAGNTGKKIVKELKKIKLNKVSSIIDADPQKWGSNLEDIEITCPKKFAERVKKNDVLIVASIYVEEILLTLKEMNINDIKICTVFGLYLAVQYNLSSPCVDALYRVEHNYLYNVEKSRVLINLGIKERVNSVCDVLETLNSPNTIFVFQSGKVGSSTIMASLKWNGFRAVHAHSIGYQTWNLGGILIQEYKQYLEFIKSKPIKIISLIREPIMRDISVFWQLIKTKRLIFAGFLEKDLYESFCKYINIAYSTSKTLDNIDPFTKGRVRWGSQFEWFNEEVKPEFGIDIFESEFNIKKGYSIIRKENTELLLIKLESLNHLEGIIGEFIGADNFTLCNSNEAKNYDYYFAYKEFLQNVKFPQAYFDFYYCDNKYMKQFYSDEELQSFKMRWKKHCYDG